MMKTVWMLLATSLFAGSAAAQDAGEVRRHFEAGRYQQVVSSTAPESPPDVIYTAAQSHQRLGATDQAVQMYNLLAGRPESDAWHFIGQSGRQIVEGQIDAAVASARQAVATNDGEAAAHYQLGLALARQQQWAEAAAAFDAAIQRQPMNAYAHYYSGMMHYRAGRHDQMAIRFDQFLKLAPEAPERPEVQSIVRTTQR